MRAKTNVVKIFFIFFVSSLFGVEDSFGQLSCQSLFEKTETRLDTPLRRSLLTLPELRSEWAKEMARSRKLLAPLSGSARAVFEDLFRTTFFYDYKHLLPFVAKAAFTQFEERLLTKKISSHSTQLTESDDLLFMPYNIYAREGELTDPYGTYLELTENIYTQNTTRPIDLALLSQMNKTLLKTGLNNTAPNEVGVLRNRAIVGPIPETSPLSQAQYEEILANPYLSTERLLPLKLQNSWHGEIFYPQIFTLGATALNMIAESQPDLAKKILDLQDSYRQLQTPHKAYNFRKHYEETTTLNFEMLEALTQSRLQRFNDLPQKKLTLPQYVNEVVSLQKDLVSIHPFANGNGRTSRFLMNFLLARVGLPPSRNYNPDNDLYLSLENWSSEVQEGMQSSLNLLRDLNDRLELDLSLLLSPHWITFDPWTQIPLELKNSSNDKVLPSEKFLEYDTTEFLAYLRALGSVEGWNPSKRYDESSFRTADQRRELNHKDFQNFIDLKAHFSTLYDHEKTGRQLLELRFADLDFIESFAEPKSQNSQKWQKKMQRWYFPSLIWRGLSRQDRAIEESEILQMFTQPSLHLASNHTLAQARTKSSEELLSLMRLDLLKYNEALVDGSFTTMAMDHHRMGPLYSQSLGLSTSSKEVVGKAFAMGAMVVAEYGKHKDEEVQEKLKARVSVAAYRAKKDVELARLKPILSDFSYKYPRQQEILAIGGVDPDAVMVVQIYDANGNVEWTYARSQENPAQVQLIRGRYVPGETVLNPGDIVKTFELFAAKETLPAPPAQDDKSKFQKFIEKLKTIFSIK